MSLKAEITIVVTQKNRFHYDKNLYISLSLRVSDHHDFGATVKLNVLPTNFLSSSEKFLIGTLREGKSLWLGQKIFRISQATIHNSFFGFSNNRDSGAGMKIKDFIVNFSSTNMMFSH